jgi:outer membrane protein assembly factor BamD (BamD/ComL family)
VLLAAGAWAQEQKPAEPPEEDASLTTKEYSFNPLQAQKEVQIGNYYFKSGKYSAALGRFREAVKWNENYAEAYLRMSEAYDKLKDPAAARKALEKYVALEPKGKQAEQARKRLSGKK